jgi:hypothetical protein
MTALLRERVKSGPGLGDRIGHGVRLGFLTRLRVSQLTARVGR